MQQLLHCRLRHSLFLAAHRGQQWKEEYKHYRHYMDTNNMQNDYSMFIYDEELGTNNNTKFQLEIGRRANLVGWTISICFML